MGLSEKLSSYLTHCMESELWEERIEKQIDTLQRSSGTQGSFYILEHVFFILKKVYTR